MSEETESIRDKVEVAMEYGINIVSFVTPNTRDEAFADAIFAANKLRGELDSGDETRPPTATEFKKANELDEDETAEVMVFRQELHDLFVKHNAYNTTKVLAEFAKVLSTEAKVCDDVLEMNLQQEFNLNKKVTLGKKQLHQDFIVLRNLIIEMAKTLGWKPESNDWKTTIPAKSANYADEMPMRKAEVAFYSHSYRVQQINTVRDESGEVISSELVREREFEAGENATSLAHAVGLLPSLTRKGILGFINALCESFGIEDFKALGEDYKSGRPDEPSFTFVYSDDTYFNLFILPANTMQKGN
jgi:hypothetical protein